MEMVEVYGLTAQITRWGPPVQGRAEHGEELHWLGDRSDYELVRGFLVPRDARIEFRCFLLPSGSAAEQASARAIARPVPRPETADPAGAHVLYELPPLRFIATIHGVVEVAGCQPRMQEIKVSRWGGPDHGLSQSLLAKIPVAELAFRALARLSLTSRQATEYQIMPGADHWQRLLGHEFGDRAAGIDDLPLPDLIDPDGRPWWRVVVSTRAGRELGKEKRTRRGPEFLAEVSAVYTAAIAAGISGPDAVADHFKKPRGSSTVFRWIQQAKQLGGTDAQDQ